MYSNVNGCPQNVLFAFPIKKIRYPPTKNETGYVPLSSPG